jgi:glycopeptide antibiotics resistance protein
VLAGWVVLVVGAPFAIIVAWVRHRSGVDRRRVALELVFALYVLVLVDLVLFPLRLDPGLRADDAVWDYDAFLRDWVNLTPFATVTELWEGASACQAVRQLGGNLLLLLPLGVLAPALFRRMRSFPVLILVAAGAAVSMEGAQFLARVARLSLRSVDVDDAILNFAGALLGYLIGRVWSRASRAPRVSVPPLRADRL